MAQKTERSGDGSRDGKVAVFGSTNPEVPHDGIQRLVSLVELKAEHEQHYREMHAEVWPEVVAAIKNANIQNYSIHVVDLGGRRYLLSYMEYTGNDIQADFASIAIDETTRDRWWPVTDSYQEVIPGTPKGEQWLPTERLMHIP